ncbi:hypothetical protein Gpo141_00003814 [Globisporangium polare]
MINRRRAPPLPTFQRLQASMREFDNLPFSMGSTGNNNNNSIPSSNSNNAMNMHMFQGGSVPVNMNPNGAAIVPPSTMSSSCSARNASGATSTGNNNNANNTNSDPAWRETGGDDLRRLRTRSVVNIERMLRNHQPHDVLTQVPENYDWRSKTFQLALKIEKLMFLAATSRENYLNEHTLRSRVQLLSRHLVRIRKRKNAMASSATSV